MKNIDLSENDSKLVLELVLHAPAGGSGYTIADSRSALKIADKLEAMPDGGVLDLEDAEHVWLSARIQAQTWLRASREIVSLVDKITTA